MTPTLVTKSLDWFIGVLNQEILNNTQCSFNINSFVRIYSPQDIFNSEFFKDQKILYPYIGYQLKAVEVDTQRVGSIVDRKKGLPLFNLYGNNSTGSIEREWITNTSQDRIKEFFLVPVTIDLELTFVTDTPNQVEEFLIQWVNLYPQLGGYLNIGEQQMTIRVIPGARIDFPEKEYLDSGAVYKLLLTCSIWTHIGQESDVAAITNKSNNSPVESSVTDKAGNIISPAIKTSIKLK